MGYASFLRLQASHVGGRSCAGGGGQKRQMKGQIDAQQRHHEKLDM